MKGRLIALLFVLANLVPVACTAAEQRPPPLSSPPMPLGVTSAPAKRCVDYQREAMQRRKFDGVFICHPGDAFPRLRLEQGISQAPVCDGPDSKCRALTCYKAELQSDFARWFCVEDGGKHVWLANESCRSVVTGQPFTDCTLMPTSGPRSVQMMDQSYPLMIYFARFWGFSLPPGTTLPQQDRPAPQAPAQDPGGADDPTN